MRLDRYLLIAPLALLALTGCGNKDELPVRVVPKTASMVVTIDMESISVKSLNFESVFQVLGGKEEGAVDKNANALMESGIDLLARGYLFADFSDEAMPYSAGVFPITDAKKFETYAGEQYKDLTWSDHEGAKVGQNDKGLTVAIKGKRVLMLNVYETPDKPETVLSKVDELLGLPKEEWLETTNSRFADQQGGDNYDVALWADVEALSKAPMAKEFLEGYSLNGTFETAELSFEDGVARLEAHTYFEEGLPKEKAEVFRKGIAPALAAAVPSDKQPVATVGLSLNVKALVGFLDEMGMLKDIVYPIELATGLGTDDLTKMLSGDLIFSMAEMKTRQVDLGTMAQEPMLVPDPQVCIAFGIADQSRLSKLLEGLGQVPQVKKVQNYYEISNGGDSKAYIIPGDGQLLLISGDDLLNEVSNRQTTPLPKANQSLLTGHAFSLFIDKTALDPEILSTVMGGSDAKNLPEWWDHIPFTTFQITADVVSDKEAVTVFELRFAETDRNSLQVLADFARYAEKHIK